MPARKPSQAATPVELSLRIRHPDIDPAEISAGVGLEPEHCFRAGEPRKTRGQDHAAGKHTQTYWLAAIDPDAWDEPIGESLPARNLEGMLFYVLLRLNTQHTFLQRIQSEGGDVALLVVIDRKSAADFALPVTLARLLVQLGVSIEFNFDS
jgi:hypothetical protein